MTAVAAAPVSGFGRPVPDTTAGTMSAPSTERPRTRTFSTPVSAVLSAVVAALPPHGVFITFAYVHARWAPPARRLLRSLRARCDEVTLTPAGPEARSSGVFTIRVRVLRDIVQPPQP